MESLRGRNCGDDDQRNEDFETFYGTFQENIPDTAQRRTELEDVKESNVKIFLGPEGISKQGSFRYGNRESIGINHGRS